MTRSILLDTHPMYAFKILKSEIKISNIIEIIEYFQTKIKENPEAVFITVFDHYAHTKELDGEIKEGILDAKNLLFCFGHTIKNIEILAFRPKSIAICELENSFVFEFLETPRPEVNNWMQTWIKELKK
ncbi:DUF6858 family protein [Sulfurimonas sp.]